MLKNDYDKVNWRPNSGDRCVFARAGARISKKPISGYVPLVGKKATVRMATSEMAYLTFDDGTERGFYIWRVDPAGPPFNFKKATLTRAGWPVSNVHKSRTDKDRPLRATVAHPTKGPLALSYDKVGRFMSNHENPVDLVNP